MTKDAITLVFASIAGRKNGIVINKDGIFLIGGPHIGLFCEGMVTSTPPPLPRPSKALLEAAGEMNMPSALVDLLKLAAG